jgi:hypothetical protein
MGHFVTVEPVRSGIGKKSLKGFGLLLGRASAERE